MKNNRFLQPPSLLFALTLFVFIGVLISRKASVKEDLPVFLVQDESFLYFELAGEVPLPGVYQLSDGVGFGDVIKLTGMSLSVAIPEIESRTEPLYSGGLLRINSKGTETATLQVGWMPASHRMALGLKLHPDRMSFVDWQALPGIGPVLAARIENDRQNNGDFERLEALKRVRGVGPKRIESWREFF